MPAIKDLTPEFVAQEIIKHWDNEEINDLIDMLSEVQGDDFADPDTSLLEEFE